MEAIGNEAQRRRVVLTLAINATVNLVHNILGNEEIDDGVLRLIYMQIVLFKRRLRGVRSKPTRITGYINVTIPRMNSMQFRQHFRMQPEVYEALERRLGPSLSKQSHFGRPVIPVRIQLLVTLWLLATPDSYRSVGDRFDVGKSSASDSFLRVVKCLCNIARDVIRWPSHAEIPACKQKFYAWAKLPNVIGAIDGTDIEIKAPHEDAQAYNNRKKRTTMILQAVCDSERRFTDCFTGYPGSVGDVRVLRNSDLYRAIHQNYRHFFPDEEYIIGDKIYPVLTWLIPAIKNTGVMTDAQKNFNKVLASSRQVIERAFALLKGRWRRLKYLDMNRTDMLAYVIIACCVLHNICLDHLQHYNEDDDFVQEGLPHINLRAGQAPVDDGGLHYNANGEAKRDYLVTIVSQ